MNIYKVIILWLFIFVSASIHSQDFGFDFFKKQRISNSYTATISLDTNTSPLTPYGNGWVTFRGTSNRQFMRTRDLDFLEFIVAVTDSFRIRSKFKFGTRKPMWIFGKGNYLLDFNSSVANVLRLGWSGYPGTWIELKTIPPTDTSTWYVFDLKYNKSTGIMRCVINDSVAFNGAFPYTSPANAYSFSVGQGGMVANQSDPTTGNSLSATAFFDGCIDYLYINKYYNGSDSSVYYNFNEGAGQYAYDSISYTAYDRSYPDGTYLGNHLQSGWNSAPDSQDVTWSRGTRKNTTTVATYGNGLWMWRGTDNGWFQDSYTNGQTIWGDYPVFTAQFNRVNVPANTWTHAGDTAHTICYWNGSAFSKIGSNGSFFTGHVTQAFADGDTLYAGGPFINAGGLANADGVAVFKGSEWDTLSKGLNDIVVSWTKHNGFVYAGGGFTASGATTIYKVAKWNYGTWGAVGSVYFCNIVWALESWNGSLYAGTDIGVFRFNGTSWDSIVGTAGKLIYALHPYKGDLWFTGEVIGKYDGSTVSSMGTMEGFVKHGIEMASNSKDLYITGSFFRIVHNGVGVVCNKLARWNGQEWSAVNYGFDMRPEDMHFLNETTLLISGDQYSADGVAMQNITVLTVP